MKTVDDLLNRIERLAALSPRGNSLMERRKRATIDNFLATTIAGDVEWRERVAAVKPAACDLDTAIALMSAFEGKRVALVKEPPAFNIPDWI